MLPYAIYLLCYINLCSLSDTRENEGGGVAMSGSRGRFEPRCPSGSPKLDWRNAKYTVMKPIGSHACRLDTPPGIHNVYTNSDGPGSNKDDDAWKAADVEQLGVRVSSTGGALNRSAAAGVRGCDGGGAGPRSWPSRSLEPGQHRSPVGRANTDLGPQQACDGTQGTRHWWLWGSLPRLERQHRRGVCAQGAEARLRP